MSSFQKLLAGPSDHPSCNSRPDRHPPATLAATLTFRLSILVLNDIRRKQSSDPLDIGPEPTMDYPFLQPVWFVATLVKKLVPFAWLLSDALDFVELRLRIYYSHNIYNVFDINFRSCAVARRWFPRSSNTSLCGRFVTGWRFPFASGWI